MTEFIRILWCTKCGTRQVFFVASKSLTCHECGNELQVVDHNSMVIVINKLDSLAREEYAKENNQ